MDDATLNVRQFRSLRQWIRDMAPTTEGGSVIELDGVYGSVMPSVGSRSIFNSVSYESAAQLERALPELERRYDEAGVIAWTVWVHEDDDAAIGALEAAGTVRDAEPMGMGLSLSGLVEPPGMDALDFDGGATDLPALRDVTESSYGMPPGTGKRSLREIWPGWTAYLARHEGEPAAGLMARDVDGDCIVTMVGTVPEARGKGIAKRLMYAALADHRDRGTETATLQATKLGHPVYRAVGYRDLGRVLMYERRRSS